MASGFFLGGVAEGMAENEKRALERDRLAQESALRTRALDITETGQRANIGINERAQTLAEKNAAREAGRDVIARADKQIADTMGVVAETVKSAVAAGRDPETIRRAVAPLVESAVRLAPRAGRDPAALGAQVEAMLTAPSAVEAATVKGTAEGTAQVAQQRVTAPAAVEAATVKGNAEAAAQIAKDRALAAAGVVDELAGFKTKDEKVKAEGSLRDDFVKQAQPFIAIRDAKNRIDNLDKTGAGDIALVFQYMKMLDPGSTVREGEFATVTSSGGPLGAAQALYNKALSEGILGDTARAHVIAQANKFYDGAVAQHERLKTSFSDITKRYKLDPANVVIDLLPTGRVVRGTTPGGLNFSTVP